jgi:hypothetical protein
MNVALRVYEQLTDAGEDKVRARAIADGFEQLQEHYAPLKDTATQGHLRETELRLQKEIREVELKLQKEIEGVRLEVAEVRREIKEVELKLGNEIREVELKLTKEIKQLDVKIADSKAELVRWVVAVAMLQFALISGLLLKLTHAI